MGKDKWKLGIKTSHLEINKFLKEREFFLRGNVYAYIMIREHSIDIDEKIDMEFARILASRNS